MTSPRYNAVTDPPSSAGVEPPSPDLVLELGLAFWGSKALLSAVELGVFSELAKNPLSGDALAAAIGLHPRSARDFLDALVALGMLTRDGDTYANAAATDLYLDRAKPSYIGGMLEMANARLYPFWGSLTEALCTGQPQNEIRSGGNLFDELYGDSHKLSQFLRAMTGVSLGAHRAMAERFPWQRYHTVVDIGCAEGGLPVQLAHAHGHLSGGGFDLPVVEPLFQDYVNSFGLQERLRFYPGDFFVDPLPHADVLTMGHILHDWPLEEKKTLLAKAHEALPDGGALVVYDAIIDDERQNNAFGLLMSLNMLIETPGGFDYTAADCSAWMREAGFKQTYVQHLIGPDSMIVGIR
jgi:hypothetical protein